MGMGTGHASPRENPPLVFFILLILLGVRYLWAGLRRNSGWYDGRHARRGFGLFEFSAGERNEYLSAFWILGGAISIITGVIGVGWYLWSWL